MTPTSLPGFDPGRHQVAEASYVAAQGGTGPPLLLLHGFPETHACWHRVAPRLSEDGAAGRRITCPLLLVTGEDEEQLADAPEVWKAWTEQLTAERVPGGHFIQEEAPDPLSEILRGFLDERRG